MLGLTWSIEGESRVRIRLVRLCKVILELRGIVLGQDEVSTSHAEAERESPGKAPYQAVWEAGSGRDEGHVSQAVWDAGGWAG